VRTTARRVGLRHGTSNGALVVSESRDYLPAGWMPATAAELNDVAGLPAVVAAVLAVWAVLVDHAVTRWMCTLLHDLLLAQSADDREPLCRVSTVELHSAPGSSTVQS
jgi:hypothetical protein